MPLSIHLFRLIAISYRGWSATRRFAPKILEIWDKEAKPHQPHQSYLLGRLMLDDAGTDILIKCSLPVKQMVGYLKEIIEISQTIIQSSKRHIWWCQKGIARRIIKLGKSNIFSILFNFIFARQSFLCSAFLNDLIDALDELRSKNEGFNIGWFRGWTVLTLEF